MTTMWIGPDPALFVGDIGFLIEQENTNNNSVRYELRDTPAYTNKSREPMLYGWCGSYNNLATYGRGLWKVERTARNGRALIRKLEGDELEAGLEELGYPELA